VTVPTLLLVGMELTTAMLVMAVVVIVSLELGQEQRSRGDSARRATSRPAGARSRRA
jgi:hypothetical protein